MTAAATVAVTTDLERGGRWTSLRSVGPTGSREWLWRNPAVSTAARAAVRPGSVFVDAGGGEECLPSVTGCPRTGEDHGDVWHRAWQGSPGDAVVFAPARGLTLRRRLREAGGAVRAEYAIGGRPGTGLLHAVHLLLDLSAAARIRVVGTPAVAIQDRPRAGRVTRTTWPDGLGVPLDRVGPDDATATCAVVASDAVDIVDGEDRLSLRWGAAADVPVSFVLWRNLGGWPPGAPYRSIGVEPMVGAATALAAAGPDERAVIGADGTLEWWLEITAGSSAVGRPATLRPPG